MDWEKITQADTSHIANDEDAAEQYFELLSMVRYFFCIWKPGNHISKIISLLHRAVEGVCFWLRERIITGVEITSGHHCGGETFQGIFSRIG